MVTYKQLEVKYVPVNSKADSEGIYIHNYIICLMCFKWFESD